MIQAPRAIPEDDPGTRCDGEADIKDADGLIEAPVRMMEPFVVQRDVELGDPQGWVVPLRWCEIYCDNRVGGTSEVLAGKSKSAEKGQTYGSPDVVAVDLEDLALLHILGGGTCSLGTQMPQVRCVIASPLENCHGWGQLAIDTNCNN